MNANQDFLKLDPKDIKKTNHMAITILPMIFASSVLFSSFVIYFSPFMRTFFTFENPLRVKKDSPKLTIIRKMNSKLWKSVTVGMVSLACFCIFTSRYIIHKDTQVDKYKELLDDYIHFKYQFVINEPAKQIEK